MLAMLDDAHKLSRHFLVVSRISSYTTWQGLALLYNLHVIMLSYQSGMFLQCRDVMVANYGCFMSFFIQHFERTCQPLHRAALSNMAASKKNISYYVIQFYSYIDFPIYHIRNHFLRIT